MLGVSWNNQPVKIDDLLRRQDELQSEAAALRSDLALDTHLSRHGIVMDVGSAVISCLERWYDVQRLAGRSTASELRQIRELVISQAVACLPGQL